jgi:eukaryotic-like serine/threonine-protein kinase
VHAEPSSERLEPGTVVAGRFVVDHSLGEGATGIVYSARRSSDGLRVALKVIHRSVCYDQLVLKRFEREATILKQLEGNHIVRLLDIAVHDELPVLVLEYVEGKSLDAALRAGKPTIDQAVEITLQICAALGAAHAGGFVHRDLKPGNVICQGDLGGFRVPMMWVVDFGLGKALHRDAAPISMTERDLILGTPEYMSPEQARGDDVDHRGDIYAAGVILFELLTGRVPFRSNTPMNTMTAHLYEPIPSARSVSPERGISPALEAVLFRALAKEPADRYPTARAFAEALAAARREVHVVAPRPVTAEDARALAEKDTELELRDAAEEARKQAEIVLDKRAAAKGMNSSEGGAPKRGVWIAVALVLVFAAVVLGALMGSR